MLNIQSKHLAWFLPSYRKQLAEQHTADAAFAVEHCKMEGGRDMESENNPGEGNTATPLVTFKSPGKLLPPHIQRAHQMRAKRAKKKASHEPVSTPEVFASSKYLTKKQEQNCIHKTTRRETMSGTSERQRITLLKERLQEAVSRQQYGEAAKLKQELNQNVRIAEVKAAANEEKRVLLSIKPENKVFQTELAKLQDSHEESMRELRQDLEDAKKRDRTHVEVMGRTSIATHE